MHVVTSYSSIDKTSLHFKNSLKSIVLIHLLKTARLIKPTVSGRLFDTATTLLAKKIYSDITTSRPVKFVGMSPGGE